MLSRIGFTALLRCPTRRSCVRDHRRVALHRAVTTPPSPCPPGLGPPSPVPPSPASTHHITLPSQRRRQPCWPFVTHTIKKGTWSHALAGRFHHCSARLVTGTQGGRHPAVGTRR